MNAQTATARIHAEAALRSGYRFTFEPYPHRVRVRCAGLTVADSAAVMRLSETRLAPVYYFPRADVRMDLMRPSDYVSHCPFKGNASHYTFVHDSHAIENLLWSYEDPLDEARAIKDYVAFYPDRVDAIEDCDGTQADGEQAASAESANPLLPWLLQEAPRLATPEALTGGLASHLRLAGIPVSRLAVVIRTLHPQVIGTNYRWSAVSGEVEVFQATRARLNTEEYTNSPLLPIFEGAGGIRRRLDIPDPVLDYGILKELLEAGASDYVAMPMAFSDGQLHALTLTTDRRGGFTTTELGHVYEILGVLGRLYEGYAMRRTAITLLETYLGQHAGERVLDGQIARGDGEDVEAVIWFCDLRDSTPLAQSMSRADFLSCLNDFFDCMAGAVLDQGGQVLRFIGDAALAIFPVASAESAWMQCCTSPEGARERALAAAAEAQRRIAELNARRAASGQAALRYGLALHVGEVTYGNIGTATRLEFTVIGSAANEAARVESLCKTLHEPALLSQAFARHYPGRFVSLGRHSLRGIEGEQEIFALREAGNIT